MLLFFLANYAQMCKNKSKSTLQQDLHEIVEKEKEEEKQKMKNYKKVIKEIKNAHTIITHEQ